MPNNEPCVNVPFRERTDLATAEAGRSMSVAGAALAGAVLAGLLMAAAAVMPNTAEAGSQGSYIQSRGAAATPQGASNLCYKYAWACSNTNFSMQEGNSVLRAADYVNRSVNGSVREVSDSTQYGRKEHWALPSSRGGDCEDFALLKKMKLIQYGVNADDLMLATVLDRNRASHAVLVVRTQFGDYVLDNQRREILPWRSTGYTFLKMQNPDAMGQWNAILSGGLIKEAPTGSHQRIVVKAGKTTVAGSRRTASQKIREAAPLTR